MCTFEDILKEKEVDLLKEELQQRKDDFISMMNHELRTPLSVLAGYISFMKFKPILTEEERVNVFQVLNKNLSRLERLIIASTTMTHLQRKMFHLTKKEVHLENFLQEIHQDYHSRLGDEIEFSAINCSNITIYIDPERFRQVIDNLLDNAIKNTPENKKIKIITQILNNSLIMKIIDNGVGIKKENIERIFDQFITIPSKYSTTGTGIGLYISKEIIKAHGGDLNAYSEGDDKGSTFTITVPADKSNV